MGQKELAETIRTSPKHWDDVTKDRISPSIINDMAQIATALYIKTDCLHSYQGDLIHDGAQIMYAVFHQCYDKRDGGFYCLPVKFNWYIKSQCGTWLWREGGEGDACCARNADEYPFIYHIEIEQVIANEGVLCGKITCTKYPGM